MDEHTKNALDLAAIATTLGALVDLLPALAALASLVWTGIRIYEWWKGRRGE